MDARQRRTREKLDEVIVRLAGATSIGDVSVSDIARAAHISRDTFYRWAPSPVDLLADTLQRKLEVALAETPGARPGSLPYDLDPLTDTVLRFIKAHADIYRRASSPRLDATLRDGLVSVIEARLTEWIEANPSILPRLDGAEPDAFSRAVFVAYAASGAAGAFEVWLASGDLDDLDGVKARIYAAAASWWTQG